MGQSTCVITEAGGSCFAPHLWVSRKVSRMVSGVKIAPSQPVAGGG